MKTDKNSYEWLETQKAIALNSDELAYQKLFIHFHENLLFFSYSITKDMDSAEDIVADIWVKIWSMGKDLLKIKNLKTYLYQAVKNSTLNYVSKKKYEQDISPTLAPPSSVNTPEDILISKESILKITEAIDALPPKCKMVFSLIRDNGCTYKEAAEIMEISVNTVDRHMQLALRKIHESIKDL